MQKDSIAFNSISVPDEGRSYKDLLKELDALRLLLLGEKREISDSGSFEKPEADYYENVNYFKIYSSESQKQKKILETLFKQNLSLAKQVFKLEGFHFEIKQQGFMRSLNLDKAADFLVNTVNKKLTIIKKTVAMEKKHLKSEQLALLLEPLQQLNQNLSLNEDLKLELQESKNALINPFKNKVKSLGDSVKTPKKITAPKDSLERYERKDEFFKEEGRIELLEQLPSEVQTLSLSSLEFANSLKKEKENTILTLTALINIIPKNYKNMLEQLEECEELSKNQNDEDIEAILNKIKKIDFSIRNILENQSSIDFIPQDFVEKRQVSLEELVKKLEAALAPYNTIISSLESHKSDIQTFCTDMEAYLSKLPPQEFEENSIMPLNISLLSAKDLIGRIEESLKAPFSASFETLEALNNESVPDFSDMTSKVQKKVVSQVLETSDDLNVSSILDSSEQEEEDIQSGESELNISNEKEKYINDDNHQGLEKKSALESIEKKEESDKSNREETEELSEDTSTQTEFAEESKVKNQSLSLVKAPAGRGSHYSFFVLSSLALFGAGAAIALRNKYPDSIPNSIPEVVDAAVDAVRKMCSIQ